MADEIRIKGLFLRTIIGINDDEREHKQDVRINLSLTVDTRPAARSDDIQDAVNYRTITKDVIDLVENSRFLPSGGGPSEAIHHDAPATADANTKTPASMRRVFIPIISPP